MTRFSAIVGGLLALVVCGVLFTQASAQTPPPWTTLFDGRNLDAFNPVGTANWKIADGAVQADSGTGFLVTPNCVMSNWHVFEYPQNGGALGPLSDYAVRFDYRAPGNEQHQGQQRAHQRPGIAE